MRFLSLLTFLLVLALGAYGQEEQSPVPVQLEDDGYPRGHSGGPPWPEDYCRYSKKGPRGPGKPSLQKSFENWGNVNSWGKEASWGTTHWWMKRYKWNNPWHCRNACKACFRVAFHVNSPWADCYRRWTIAKCWINYRPDLSDDTDANPELPEHVTHEIPYHEE